MTSGSRNGSSRSGSLTKHHTKGKGEKMAKKIVPANQNQQGTTSVCIPLYRLQVVKESHSPLYGAPRISDSHDVSRFLRAHFEGRPHEEFLVVFLDAKNTPVGYQVVSVGSLTLSIVHPREAFKAAVCMSAAAVIFSHNHPSGDPTPSLEDRTLTKRLVSAGELLGIRVLDHIVMGEGRHVSFADEGWLCGEG
jgi:DNA repair protein RadC